MTNNLYRNVGTQASPISWLHERAVALLWDELRRSLFENGRNPNGSRGPERLRREPRVLRVRTADGWSGDLCGGGVARIDFPDDLTHIGGVIPDIALYSADNRPIRLIEVVVTSPPDSKKQSKLDTLAARGIEVVVVPVKDKHDLMEMVWDHEEPFADRNHPHPAAYLGGHSESGACHPTCTAQLMVKALTESAPSAKRALLDALRTLKASDVDDLFPLLPHNPKRGQL